MQDAQTATGGGHREPDGVGASFGITLAALEEKMSEDSRVAPVTPPCGLKNGVPFPIQSKKCLCC